ncbi:MAG: phosphoribosylamine--glycine ligase [Spirochaetales bacterium]|nr:phosphoribosylamine--glycine ligase [Spirochaetales bacterium]
MKVMVLGSGGREHALAWKLAREGHEPVCAPGNAGTAELRGARNLQLDPDDPAAVVAAARETGTELVVVGPEAPLVAGVADALRAEGVPCFGPGAAAARLESSKAFARAFMERHGVPCARTARFSDPAAGTELERFIAAHPGRLVLKKSGLAAGKGVLESDDPVELLSFGRAVLADDELLAEEFLEGFELSVFALSDGRDFAILPAARDHKKAFEGDAGPNTGGMGAVAPEPRADLALMAEIRKRLVEPTFSGMSAEGLAYRGVVFFGVMVTASGPKLLEYNVRFGDPETQSLLPILPEGFGELLRDAAEGRLDQAPIRTFEARPDRAACGFVVAAPGYPGAYPKGLAVRSLPEAENPDGLLFHASTTRASDGILHTGGGRCFAAVGLGADSVRARENGLALAAAVDFDGARFRRDIGA